MDVGTHLPFVPIYVFGIFQKEPTSQLCSKPSCAQVFPDSPGYSIRHHFYTSLKSTRDNMGRSELCRNTYKQKNATSAVTVGIPTPGSADESWAG